MSIMASNIIPFEKGYCSKKENYDDWNDELPLQFTNYKTK